MNNPNVNVDVLLPILRQIPLFASLDEALHREIIQRIVLMYYPANYVLFKEGDEGDALYIIKNGQVEIYKEPKEEGDFAKKVWLLSQIKVFWRDGSDFRSPKKRFCKGYDRLRSVYSQ